MELTYRLPISPHTNPRERGATDIGGFYLPRLEQLPAQITDRYKPR
jgi:hypothetical protein